MVARIRFRQNAFPVCQLDYVQPIRLVFFNLCQQLN